MQRNRQQDAAATAEWCKICMRSFPNWDLYTQHKKYSRNHIACDVCATDFMTDEGLRRHRHLMHPAEQELSCAGCQQTFVRLGSLMNHIETEKCWSQSTKGQLLAQKYHIDLEFRKAKAELDRQANSMDSPEKKPKSTLPAASKAFLDKPLQPVFATPAQQSPQLSISRSTAQHPASNDHTKIFGSSATPNSQSNHGRSTSRNGFSVPEIEEASNTGGVDLFAQPPAPIPLKPGEDLISFETTMNSAWGPRNGNVGDTTEPGKRNIFIENVEDFPALPNAAASKKENLDKPSAAPKNQTWPTVQSLMDAPIVMDNSKPVTNSAWDSVKPVGDSHNSVQQKTAIKQPSTQTTNVAQQNNKVINQSTNSQISNTENKNSHSAWGQQKNLFPDAPPAVAPPAEMLRTMTTDAKKEKNDWPEHDPDNPTFRVQKYWVSFTGKYKCPHRYCPRSYDNPSSFVQHLKSAAHRDDKLQCRHCLRYFATFTALTQHSEAQGVRCNIRETDFYDQALNDITAGVSKVAGRHADETVRYAIQEVDEKKLENMARDMADHHKKVKEAMAEAKRNYWNQHKPKW